MSEHEKAAGICLLFLFLTTSCAGADGEQQAAMTRDVAGIQDAAWRRIPEIEEILVTYCLGDTGKVWISNSKAEQRALYTPAFYENCSSGTGVSHVWPCCEDGKTYAVIHSRQELESYFAALVQNPGIDRNLSAGREWIDAYLHTVDQVVDFDNEALVLSSTPYGPTGMARASIDFEQQDRTLKAMIRIEVPPPPLTPDTALFRFAFAVSRSEIEKVEIFVDSPAVPDLGVPSSEAAASFSIAEPK